MVKHVRGSFEFTGLVWVWVWVLGLTCRLQLDLELDIKYVAAICDNIHLFKYVTTLQGYGSYWETTMWRPKEVRALAACELSYEFLMPEQIVGSEEEEQNRASCKSPAHCDPHSNRRT